MEITLEDLDVSFLLEKVRADSVTWLDFNRVTAAVATSRSRFCNPFDLYFGSLDDYRRGKKFTLDGSTAFFTGSVGDIANVSFGTNDATLCFVLSFADAVCAANETIFNAGCTGWPAGAPGIALYRTAGFSDQFYTYLDDGSAAMAIGTHDLTGLGDGNLHLVTIKYDRDGNCTAQLDKGKPDIGHSLASNQLSITNTFQDIFGVWPGYSGYMKGSIAFMSLHHRLLTQEEINAIYDRYV